MSLIGGQILGTKFLRPNSLCVVEEKLSVSRQMVSFQLWLCSKKLELEGEFAPLWLQPGTVVVSTAASCSRTITLRGTSSTILHGYGCLAFVCKVCTVSDSLLSFRFAG